jgi:circadian clock protein KaiC
MLLGSLGQPALIRRELFRLREWLETSGLTSILTAKIQDGTRISADYEALQFLADALVVLRDRVVDGAGVRTMRVSKYKGSAHSTNEFPFTITGDGIEVATGTAATLAYPSSGERVSSGVERLDAMLCGGYHRGSAILISGAPGSAKTSLATSFVAAACSRGEKTLFVTFDEGADQVVENASSIGIRLAKHRKSGLLAMAALRAYSDAAESHVARIRRLVREHQPRNLVIDPISAFGRSERDPIGAQAAVQLVDKARTAGITLLATTLAVNSATSIEDTLSGVSTIADTWVHVSYVAREGERNRALTVIKSRGTNHSNQVGELILSDKGVTLADVYLSDGQVLMGTQRWEKEHLDRVARDLARREAELREAQAQHAVAEAKARWQALASELASKEAELERLRAARAIDVAAAEAADAHRGQLRGSPRVTSTAPSPVAKRKLRR